MYDYVLEAAQTRLLIKKKGTEKWQATLKK
jgi:hypothetical protein